MQRGVSLAPRQAARAARVGRRPWFVFVALVAVVVVGATTSAAMIVQDPVKRASTSSTRAWSIGPLVPPTKPAAAAGIPFGPPKLPPGALGKLFTGTKLAPSPELIVKTLSQARANGTRVFLILVGPQRHYKNEDGTFNLERWKARVDRFRGIDFREFVKDGTIIAHQLLSEAKARGQWGGIVIPNNVLDEMARYGEEIWPAMPTVLRTDPSDLEAHAAGYMDAWPGWQWRHLDAASARYLVRKGVVERFAENQQESADRQHLGLVVGLNVVSGGDGSSDIRGWASGRWAMSPDELRAYGSQLLFRTRACAFEMWRYETPGTEFAEFHYFRRPDIAAAMAELAALAARSPARSCRT
jgi:hypothetical protein